MKKSIAVAIILLFVPAVFAQVTCDDTDDGPESISKPEPYIAEKGTVKYGLTSKSDYCMAMEDSYSAGEGAWVREFYCDEVGGVVNRLYRDYECADYGYEKCVDGACTGQPKKKEKKDEPEYIELPRCGDKKVNPVYGEQCDPPDKICYLDGKIGLCTDKCKCKLYEGGETEEESDGQAQENQTQDEEGQEEQQAEQDEKKQQPKSRINESSADRERKPLPEEYKEPKSVGFFRGLANVFKKMFGWMFGWLK